MKKLFNKKVNEDEIEKVDAEVVETEETEETQPKKSHKKLLIGAGIGAAVLTVAGLLLHKKNTDTEMDWYDEESEDDDEAETSDESDETSDEPTSEE